MLIETDNPDISYESDDLDGADICTVIAQICDYADVPPLTILFAIEDDTLGESDNEHIGRLIEDIIQSTQSNADRALRIIIATFAKLLEEGE